MGHNQEAHDAECAEITRALKLASRRQTIPKRITIFTDAQAAIRRMASEEPGPGQQYALQARKHVATLRKPPGIIIEIRWYPAHKGVGGNEKADEWAKVAAEEPDARGVEWLSYSDRNGARAIRSQGLLRISSGRSLRKRRWRCASGLEAEPPRQNTGAKEPEAGQHGYREHQEACLAVLPGEDGALPFRTVLPLDEEPAHPAVLVVPVLDVDPEAPLQGVP